MLSTTAHRNVDSLSGSAAQTTKIRRPDLECHHSRFYKDVIPKGRPTKQDKEATGDSDDEDKGSRKKYQGTKLSGCGWKAKAVFLKAAQAWVFVIRSHEHKHDPDENPWDIAIHRNRRQASEDFQKRLLELAMMAKASGTDVAEQLMKEYPLINVRSRDIWNAIQARRLLALGLAHSLPSVFKHPRLRSQRYCGTA